MNRSLIKPNGKYHMPESERKSVNSLFDKFQFHPEVKNVSEKLFKDGHYPQAILEAFKLVVRTVKNKSNRNDLDGTKLMSEVFSKNAPILPLNSLKTQTEKDEQEGFMFLCMGAVLGIRNPKAHELVVQNNPWKALEYIAFASLITRIVNECKVPIKAPSAQVNIENKTPNRQQEIKNTGIQKTDIPIIKKVGEFAVIKCAYCEGRARVNGEPFDLFFGNNGCPACNGKGFGKLKEPFVRCLHCNGKGRTMGEPFELFGHPVCQKCKGLGAQSL